MTNKRKFAIIKEHIVPKSRNYRMGCVFKDSDDEISLQRMIDDIDYELKKLEYIKDSYKLYVKTDKTGRDKMLFAETMLSLFRNVFGEDYE